MLVRLLIIFILLSSSAIVLAQEEISIHQIEHEYYKNHPELTEESNQQSHGINLHRKDLSSPGALSYVVYGFHPYWNSDSKALDYYYNLLTHIAYFSVDADVSASTTGGILASNKWPSTQIVNYARNNGIKVHLTVTMFSNHDRVLNNSLNRKNLINNIITQMDLRGADGVNIDFEAIPKGSAAGFCSFINELGTTLKSIGKELVIDIPSVDWNSVFTSYFFSINNSLVDYYFLMAYSYYYKGSTTAGPISPLTTGTKSYHVTRSIDTYLQAGLPASKLIGGINYYGIDWPVKTSDRMALTSGSGSSVFYNSVKSNLSNISNENKFFDMTYYSPWYRYQSGSQWHQVWYDDSLSLAAKYDLFKSRSIAGAGMWALGYDWNYPELWGAIKDKFGTKIISNVAGQNIPGNYKLLQNYPNPFNPSTTIRFYIPVNSYVKFIIFDLLGREIKTLTNEIKSAGSYEINWDGKDTKGKDVSGGIYLGCLSVNEHFEVLKMNLLR